MRTRRRPRQPQPSRRRVAWVLTLAVAASAHATFPASSASSRCSTLVLLFTDTKDPAAAAKAIARRIDASDVRATAKRAGCTIEVQRSGIDLRVGLPRLPAEEATGLTRRNPLEFRGVIREVDPTTPTTTKPPYGSALLFDKDQTRGYVVGPAELTGEIVQSAQSVIDPTGNWTVDVQLTKTGSPAFDALAAKYYQQQIAIVVNDAVAMAPTINARRFGGRLTLAGNFTAAETKSLAALLMTNYPASLRFRGVARG